MLFVFCACGVGGLPTTTTDPIERADAGPVRMSACADDTGCPTGMLCEACADGVTSCVPGCRTDAQCGPNLICTHNVQCLSCPCPSGWCDLDPCRDLDGDGYAAALTGACPGKQVGDCDDSVASTHPNGLERCANGRDDDCDGRTDARDTECRDSCPGTFFCSTSLNCNSQQYCERGCCEVCPVPANPTCDATQCLLPGGLDAKGCFAAPVCGACMSCSNVYEPVCGKNFGTYTNACLAQAAGTQVLHDGECDRGEGATCAGLGDCYYNQVCRSVNAELRCSRRGTCTVDADCDAVTSVVSCGDAGVADWVCRNERCAASCP